MAFASDSALADYCARLQIIFIYLLIKARYIQPGYSSTPVEISEQSCF